ncbi:MAG: hypothetical protein BIFFINMI_01493 [Phycisphaerae bacterium]|nr:hypothetical protein [Phycisphaerae bacterium]
MIQAGNADRLLIQVTAGNVRNHHISIAGHYSFFPRDVFGQPRRSDPKTGKPISIALAGLDRTIETDIGTDADGKPRRQFRRRAWVREFFQHHHVKPGDQLELRRTGDRCYCLSLATRNGSTPRFRAAEFFAGIGLVRLALEKHGFEVVFANDIDPDKHEMYAANFPAGDFSLGDIHRLTAQDIPDIDLATASFPCNDLSIAGAMNGIHAGQSSAFWGLVRLLDHMGGRRPPLLLLENVPGFLMSHDGRDFHAALHALNELGYACDTFMLDAAAFVPQSRLRLFVVGQLHEPGGPAFGLEPSAIRPAALVRFIHAHADIRWNIRPLATPPVRRADLESIIEDLPANDPAWWNKERTNYFMAQLSDRHAAVARKMIRQPFVSYGTAFRRVRHGRSMAELRTDGLAGCLRTPRGGSGRQILFKAGNGRRQVRLLTARECARLQGVPDDYRIGGIPLNQALFGFGDAVCVPVISWIAEHYLNPLAAPANSSTISS